MCQEARSDVGTSPHLHLFLCSAGVYMDARTHTHTHALMHTPNSHSVRTLSFLQNVVQALKCQRGGPPALSVEFKVLSVVERESLGAERPLVPSVEVSRADLGVTKEQALHTRSLAHLSPLR